ncbi:hypothetical protein LXL04_001679 [Taraxacum kok-saghyz]
MMNLQKVQMLHLHSKESLQSSAFSAQLVFDLWNVVHKKDLQKSSRLDLKTLDFSMEGMIHYWSQLDSMDMEVDLQTRIVPGWKKPIWALFLTKHQLTLFCHHNWSR